MLITRTVESDYRREFTASLNEITRQIAGNIARALRFKKAEVKDKDGNPYGYVIIAWKTDALRSYIWNVKLSLVSTLSITMLAVVAAILFLTTKLMTGPLGLISDRMFGLAKLDTSSPVPCDRSARDIRSTTETLNRAVDRFLDDVAAA